MTPPTETLCCPDCRTPQSVPAASPRGAALRLRCIACGEALGDDDDVTRVRAALEVPTAPVDERWHLVIEGQVVGPMTRAEVERHHQVATIGDDALVWHEGFRGWARLTDTTTFTPLVGGRRLAPRPCTSVVPDLTDVADLVETSTLADPGQRALITGETMVTPILPPPPPDSSRVADLLRVTSLLTASILAAMATVGSVGLATGML